MKIQLTTNQRNRKLLQQYANAKAPRGYDPARQEAEYRFWLQLTDNVRHLREVQARARLRLGPGGTT